jgi:hypothetical protein
LQREDAGLLIVSPWLLPLNGSAVAVLTDTPWPSATAAVGSKCKGREITHPNAERASAAQVCTEAFPVCLKSLFRLLVS